MSIRAIALELYRAQQRLESLRSRLAVAASEEERLALAGPLSEAEREWRLLRGMLDGKKEPPPSGRGFGGSGRGG